MKQLLLIKWSFATILQNHSMKKDMIYTVMIVSSLLLQVDIEYVLDAHIASDFVLYNIDYTTCCAFHFLKIPVLSPIFWQNH